eukprot:5237613-Pyramimonas_sp.AAC.1
MTRVTCYLLHDAQEDLLWAFGCLFSRAYGSREHMGLAPYIDLINHRAGSLKPLPYEFEGLEGYALRTSASTKGSQAPGQVIPPSVVTLLPANHVTLPSASPCPLTATPPSVSPFCPPTGG